MIGFFNQADYFPYDGDEGSNSYNPTSNDRMIIYCGFPDASTGSLGLYSPDSIIATVGHEFQHLVAYSRTAYSLFLSGEANPQDEEGWLAEAEAHLHHRRTRSRQLPGSPNWMRVSVAISVVHLANG